MTAFTFYELLGDVDEQLVCAARPERKHRRPVRPLLLAAVLALLLAGFSEAVNGSVSNLFAPLYGSSRTEIIDGVGRPVNASATAGGYTITAEAVIGDRYNFAIVYTLTRDDGEPIPDNIAFDDWTNSLLTGSGAGVYGAEDVEGLPANQKRLIEQWGRELPLILRRHAHVRFSGLHELVEDGTPGEGPLLAEGPWELDFSLRYADTTRQVSIPRDYVVTDENGREYTISKVQLSPFSVHVNLTTANPSAGYTWEEYKAAGRPGNEQEYLPDFTVELKLKDGIEPPWVGKNVSGHGTIGEPTQKNSVNAHFDVPVLPDEVEAIVLCGTEIPVK